MFLLSARLGAALGYVGIGVGERLLIFGLRSVLYCCRTRICHSLERKQNLQYNYCWDPEQGRYCCQNGPQGRCSDISAATILKNAGAAACGGDELESVNGQPQRQNAVSENFRNDPVFYIHCRKVLAPLEL